MLCHFLSFIVFHKQLVYKQLALGWQIPKQLSGLNSPSLSNSTNYRLGKSGAFSLKQTYNSWFTGNTPNLSYHKSIIEKISKAMIINIDFGSENYCIPWRHRLLGQTTKQPLSNSEPQKSWKYKQLWGLSHDLSC